MVGVSPQSYQDPIHPSPNLMKDNRKFQMDIVILKFEDYRFRILYLTYPEVSFFLEVRF